MKPLPHLRVAGAFLVEPTSFQAFQSLDAPLVMGEGAIVSVTLLTPLVLRRLRDRAGHSALI